MNTACYTADEIIESLRRYSLNDTFLNQYNTPVYTLDTTATKAVGATYAFHPSSEAVDKLMDFSRQCRRMACALIGGLAA